MSFFTNEERRKNATEAFERAQGYADKGNYKTAAGLFSQTAQSFGEMQDWENAGAAQQNAAFYSLKFSQQYPTITPYKEDAAKKYEEAGRAFSFAKNESGMEQNYLEAIEIHLQLGDNFRAGQLYAALSGKEKAFGNMAKAKKYLLAAADLYDSFSNCRLTAQEYREEAAKMN